MSWFNDALAFCLKLLINFRIIYIYKLNRYLYVYMYIYLSFRKLNSYIIQLFKLTLKRPKGPIKTKFLLPKEFPMRDYRKNFL